MIVKKNLLILLVLPFFAFVCSKKEDKCLQAKVIRISCASFVVQVLNKDSVGSYGWKDVGGNGTYNNVLNISNTCEIGKWSKGEEMYFNIEDTLKPNNCISCMMYDAPPEKTVMVQDVTKEKCK